MIYLDIDDLLHVAEVVLPAVQIRDGGLLEAALARPQTTIFGKLAYPDLPTQAAASMHSISRNHALVDGNKRLALAATIAFLGLNGHRLKLTNDEAYTLVMAVCQGQLNDVTEISTSLSIESR